MRKFDVKYAEKVLPVIMVSYIEDDVLREVSLGGGIMPLDAHEMNMARLLDCMWDKMQEACGFFRESGRPLNFLEMEKALAARGIPVRSRMRRGFSSFQVTFGRVCFILDEKWGNVQAVFEGDSGRSYSPVRVKAPYGEPDEFIDFMEEFAGFAARFETDVRELEMNCQNRWIQMNISRITADAIVDGMCRDNGIIRWDGEQYDPSLLEFYFKAKGRMPFRWVCRLDELRERISEVPQLAVSQEKCSATEIFCRRHELNVSMATMLEILGQE